MRQPVGHPAQPTDYFYGRVVSPHCGARLFLFMRHPDNDAYNRVLELSFVRHRQIIGRDRVANSLR